MRSTADLLDKADRILARVDRNLMCHWDDPRKDTPHWIPLVVTSKGEDFWEGLLYTIVGVAGGISVGVGLLELGRWLGWI